MPRIQLLGVDIDPLTMEELQRVVHDAVAQRSSRILANHNAHSVYLYHRDAKMRAFYGRADRVHIDGMSLVWLGRLLGRPVKREHRVTYVDWIRPLMSEASRSGYRVFYLGSRQEIAELAANQLGREFSGLQIATHHGFFDAQSSRENSRVLGAISAFRSDILIVGMGMPRQEHWILDHIDDIEAGVILTAGACMDYVAGAAPTAPRWMGRWGLEWLYRLANDPVRLWRRYLIEPWFVFRLFLRDLAARR